MTRYSRPADSKNPALDLGQHEPFTLDLNDGNGPCSYSRNHLVLVNAAEHSRLGFTAYQPSPPAPPPPPTPETTPLSRRQLRRILNVPAPKGLGFTDNDVRAIIRGLPDATTKVEAEIDYDHADMFHWDHQFVQALVPVVMSSKGLTLAQVRAAWMQASTL